MPLPRSAAKQMTTVNVQTPAEEGHPNDSFDFPYQVTEDDALTGPSYEFAADGGAPRPYQFVSQEAFAQFQSILPNNQGVYDLAFMNTPALTPDNDSKSVNPAAGSADLARPLDTPMFAPGTNRIIHSEGPVRGAPPAWAGDVQTIGRDIVGVGGPVTGDGSGYSSQLAASYYATQFAQFSQEAAAQALVSAV